jgi:hypothetical protein
MTAAGRREAQEGDEITREQCRRRKNPRGFFAWCEFNAADARATL